MADGNGGNGEGTEGRCCGRLIAKMHQPYGHSGHDFAGAEKYVGSCFHWMIYIYIFIDMYSIYRHTHTHIYIYIHTDTHKHDASTYTKV